MTSFFSKRKMKYARLDILAVIICFSLILNLFSLHRIFHCSSINHEQTRMISSHSSFSPMSTIERSKRALVKFQSLLDSIRSSTDQPWIWSPTDEYPSVPYQPTLVEHQKIPKRISNLTQLPRSVTNKIDRVCQRLIQANAHHGQLWCKLFRQCYSNTLATTTSLLDDNTTYIITGDIDLMWLRDSSAQVHQYLSLVNDSDIQRIIEGLIVRQTKFIFSNPYASSFRLTLRSNPPSDDSLESHHIKKGRNLYVAMHNYELDSLCYYLRLSYTWWKQSQRNLVFDHQWLIAVSMIIQLMIIEQHHSEISPYHYTELSNHHRGSKVVYTGMTWTGFRPSDDQTKFGYLIPSNMMASVVLKQISHMIKQLYSEQIELLSQIEQLHTDILDGIHTYGTYHHPKYGLIYVYETDGFSSPLLLDDANVPSLLSAAYLQFQNPFDPQNLILSSTRTFLLSPANPLFFQGTYASGIGSHHTNIQYVWPISIIIEGLTTKSNTSLDSVWQRLESTHAGTYFMHESFNVNNPNEYTRSWFAWANSLFSELVVNHLEQLEYWLEIH